MSRGLKKMTFPRKSVCLSETDEVTFYTWFCGLSSLFGVSLAYSALVFVILLVIKEAKRAKKQLEQSNVFVSHHAAAEEEEDVKSRQKYFDLHYEKINRVYYIEENTIDSSNTLQQESFYSNIRTESIASKDTQSNNAELILRELFVPIQEEDAAAAVKMDAKVFKKTWKRQHWSVKDFPRRSRRSTSDLHHKKLHSSLKQRSSLQLQNMRTSVSSSSVVVSPDYYQRSRRPAIVFNSQLSYSDETHSTML